MKIGTLPKAYTRTLERVLRKLIKLIAELSKPHILKQKRTTTGGVYNSYKKYLGGFKGEEYYRRLSLVRDYERDKLSIEYFEMLINNPEYEKKYKKIIDDIILKVRAGKNLTKEDKDILDFNEYIFLKGNNWHLYKGVNSSWIIYARWDFRKKILYLKMVRGRTVYKFYNVPSWVFLLIVKTPSHVGTMWWARNFGFLYSINSGRWIRKEVVGSNFIMKPNNKGIRKGYNRRYRKRKKKYEN